MNIMVFLSVCLGISVAHAQLPPAATKMINDLPGRQLSVEFVLAKAYDSSDSVRAIKAQALGLEAAYWQSLAPLGTQVTAYGSYTKNENTNASIFEAKDTKIFNVGVSKYFQTGTLLGVEFNELQQTLDTQASQFQRPNKSTAKVTLAQNLWRDGFGVMIRTQVRAGEAAREASRFALQEGIQDWAMQIVRTYYGAWFAKSQLQAAKTNFERRKRLMDVTRVKLNRGTTERADYLQVESALNQTEASLGQSRHALQETWRELVNSLKLPIEWMSLPADQIPLGLDKVDERALELCKEESSIESSREKSVEQQLWDARVKASEQSFEAAKKALNPDLRLESSYGSSGTLGDFGDRTSDAVTATNPEWTVGLKFRMPIEFYAEKAQLAREAAQHEQNKALASRAKSGHFTGWVNTCASLKTLVNNRDLLKKSVKALSERASLEERRFQLGRTSTMAVILAGDDYSNAELQLNSTQVALNQAAWEVLKLNGEIESYMQSALKTYGSK